MWDILISFDKQLLLAVNGSESLFLDGLVKTLTTAATWIPLYVALFYMVLKNNENVKKILLVVGCAAFCAVLAGAVDDGLVKPSVARWRPTHDPEIGTLVDVVNGYRGGNYGFFSAHACNTFSLAIFFSLIVRNTYLTIALVAWSLVNCWTRLYLGVHYPGDITVGLIWGSIVGTTMWYVHQKVSGTWSKGKAFVSEQYTSTGYQVVDVDVVISVLVLIFVYAVVKACFFIYK